MAVGADLISALIELCLPRPMPASRRLEGMSGWRWRLGSLPHLLAKYRRWSTTSPLTSLPSHVHGRPRVGVGVSGYGHGDNKSVNAIADPQKAITCTTLIHQRHSRSLITSRWLGPAPTRPAKRTQTGSTNRSNPDRKLAVPVASVGCTRAASLPAQPGDWSCA